MKVKTLIVLLAALLLFSAACGTSDNPSEEQIRSISDGRVPLGIPNNAQDIGEGATQFLFEVTDDEGVVTLWNVKTNAATVGAALDEVGLIERDETEMVSHVNGIRADFIEDEAWWAFYIDGEMAMAGVDSTDIEEGTTYAFIYTPA